MGKLTTVFKNADSGDKLTYALIGAIVFASLAVAAAGILNAEELINQNQGSASSYQSLTLGR